MCQVWSTVSGRGTRVRRPSSTNIPLNPSFKAHQSSNKLSVNTRMRSTGHHFVVQAFICDYK